MVQRAGAVDPWGQALPAGQVDRVRESVQMEPAGHWPSADEPVGQKLAGAQGEGALEPPRHVAPAKYGVGLARPVALQK